MKPYGRSYTSIGTRKSTQLEFVHWMIVCMLRSTFKKLCRDLADTKDDEFFPN